MSFNPDDLESAMEQREQENIEPVNLGKIDLPQLRDRQETIAAGDEAIKNSGYRPTDTLRPSTPLGYSRLPMEDIPSKGRFYPEDAILQIKAAAVKEVEHFSTMNESDPLDIDKHLNDILKSCATLTSNSDRKLNIMDIIEGDRFFIILAIKDKTFIETENVITLDIVCPNGHTNHRVLKNNILNSNPLSSEDIEKYYSKEDRCYNVATKSFGIIKMRPPRLGLVEYIYNKGRTSEMAGKYWDKSYYSILPYMFPHSSGKVRDLDIDDLYAEYKKWSNKKFAVVYRMAEKIKIGIDPYIEIVCDECGEVARTPFQIPGGPKSLFIISDIDEELL